MMVCGYCCYYLEHCSKTNHIAIKQAKHENAFWTRSSLKTCDLFLAPHKICRSPMLSLQHKDKTFSNLS